MLDRSADGTSSDGPPSDRTRIIRRQPDAPTARHAVAPPPPAPSPPTPSPPTPGSADAPPTSIIRRSPTGPQPIPSSRLDAPATSFIPAADTAFIPQPATTSIPSPHDPPTAYVPRPTPEAVGRQRAAHSSPAAASATATVAIISGWATAVIATSLITNWWGTDELFCIAVGFLTAVSAAATIGGLIALLLRRRLGRLLVGVGAVVALMIFAGLFVAGAALPGVVYAIPVLPVATVVLAALPATGRWCD